AGETWLEGLLNPRGGVTAEDPGRMRGFGHGPADPGPPDPDGAAPGAPFLPDDWDEPGDKVNRMMQADSESVALSVGKAADKGESPEKAPRMDSAALLAAAGVSSYEVAGPPARHFENAGAMLKATLEGIGRLERAMVRIQAEAGLPQRGALDQSMLNPAVILSDESDICLRNLAARIAALEQAQAALVAGALAHIARIRETLDPAAIDARIAGKGGLKNRMAPAAAAWTEYRSRWSDGQSADILFSEKALARAIDAALSQ
ncbi:MAG: type VI secretion system-associated FHA domain protein, partial [Pikeienuella sp.]